EAAGVLKYKQRKKKAEIKLNETDENLNRVMDILHELDSRMEPLQIQASAARDYLSMSEELKDADIALLAFDAKRLQRELEQLGSDAEMQSLKEAELAGEITEKEETVAGIHKQVAELDQSIDAEQSSLIEASSETE